MYKKSRIAFYSVAAITVTNAYSIEYIIKNASDENKEQIYKIVSKFRLPSILSKFTQAEFGQEYPNINLRDAFGKQEAEIKFIQEAIKSKDPNAIVFGITKSGYQLIVYDYIADTIKSEENIFDLEEKFRLSKYAKANEDWPITRACARFMENNEIQNIFWKVNEHAQQYIKNNTIDIKNIIYKLLGKFEIDSSYKIKRYLDYAKLYRDDYIRYKIKANMSRIETLLGVRYESSSKVKPLEEWNETMRKELIQYVVNCIVSEAKNPGYVIYRGGPKAPKSEIARRQSVCFSDGFFSGWILDAGANAYELSGGKNKFWKLVLDRQTLLEGQYPIYIPPAFYLLSAAGYGELFHIRTKVLAAVISSENDCVSEDALLITGILGIDPIVAGFKLDQTPEYFTTLTPEIWKVKRNSKTSQDEYEQTGQGLFDTNGEKGLKDMIDNIKEVNKDGTF